MGKTIRRFESFPSPPNLESRSQSLESMRVCGTDIKVSGRLVRVARLDADKFRFFEGEPATLLEGLKNSRQRIDLFTFMQRLPDTKPKFDFPLEWDNFAAISITTFDEWWTKQLGFKARNKAKQAEKKGVVIREIPFGEELTRGIWEIYNECPIRQGRRFPHYGKSLETVRREAATYLESSVFVGAFLEDKLIGFIKIVFDQTGTQAGLMNIVSLVQQREKAPTNALVARAVRICAERGTSYLTYSNFSYGKKEHDSLSDFKERNAFRRIEVPRYYVPLTALGQMAFRLGLHRKLSERIPEPLAKRFRELREAWYNRRFSSLTEVA
jgi:hypothetical protein